MAIAMARWNINDKRHLRAKKKTVSEPNKRVRAHLPQQQPLLPTTKGGANRAKQLDAEH